MTTETKTGRAINGSGVGAGYDVFLRLESDRVVIANVVHLSSKEEWLGVLDVDLGQDLDELAREIGQCPGPWIREMSSDSSEDENDWDSLAVRWNNLS